jgi:hypothetical protein
MKIDKINSVKEPIEEIDKLLKPQHEVPPKKVYGHDLTKMKSFKLLRKGYKRDNLLQTCKQF